MYPFIETFVSENVRLRTFAGNVSSEELTWHRDAKHRKVRIIESTGWYFQFDNQLPFELKSGIIIDIPRKTWHRVIRRKDSGDLIVEITE